MAIVTANGLESNPIDYEDSWSQPEAMRYLEFKEAIHRELRRRPEGLTWIELRQRLNLPYDRPCQTWTNRLSRKSVCSERRNLDEISGVRPSSGSGHSNSSCDRMNGLLTFPEVR